MYNKVEICGVNTSRLKVLTEAETRALLQKIRHGTPAEREQAREEMINGNLKLVLSVIQRFTNRGENLDDLFQVGCIGLMKAIDNFNPDLDVKFSTYGVPMIICLLYTSLFVFFTQMPPQRGETSSSPQITEKNSRRRSSSPFRYTYPNRVSSAVAAVSYTHLDVYKRQG